MSLLQSIRVGFRSFFDGSKRSVFSIDRLCESRRAGGVHYQHVLILLRPLGTWPISGGPRLKM